MSGGYKSPLAFWLGRVGGYPRTIKRGYRSLLAFWLGGASATYIAPAPPAPEPEVTTQAEEPRRWPGPSTIIYMEGKIPPDYLRRKREDEEIVIL